MLSHGLTRFALPINPDKIPHETDEYRYIKKSSTELGNLNFKNLLKKASNIQGIYSKGC